MSVGISPGRTLRTVAGIVTFHPERSRLIGLISSTASDVSRIIVFANSPLGAELKNAFSFAAKDTPVTVVSAGENVGLGKAYNRIVELARLEGAEFILLFDQDSMPSEGMARRLESLHDTLKEQGERPAVVGPTPIKASGESFKVPHRRAHGSQATAISVNFAISSGSLISVAAVDQVGGFNEEFFIDAIDIEWCSRAWGAGWSVWLGDGITMTHRLGNGVIHLPFGLRLTDQPPERLYTYFRNQIVMLRLPYVSAAWKLRFIASLPARCFIYGVRYRFAAPVITAISRGIIDGLLNRLGSRPAHTRSHPDPLSSGRV
jgi:rhamnosyltransferase